MGYPPFEKSSCGERQAGTGEACNKSLGDKLLSNISLLLFRLARLKYMVRQIEAKFWIWAFRCIFSRSRLAALSVPGDCKVVTAAVWRCKHDPEGFACEAGQDWGFLNWCAATFWICHVLRRCSY